MKKISIATLERLSGVKAHTFRVWEQRYNFLKPKRTPTNLRYYTLENLSQLLNITLLIKGGYKLSTLSKFDLATINEYTKQLTGDEISKTREINELIISMFSRDVEKFETTLNKCISLWGINGAIEEIIIPFLEKVQLLSYKDTSSEIHLAVTIIRKKIILGIEKTHAFQRIDKKVLLFLPEDEHYDLILLYMNYIAKREGYQILYMGTNVSVENLENIAIAHRPDILLTYLVNENQLCIDEVGKFLEQHLPASSLIVSGYIDKLTPPVSSNIKLVYHRQIKDLFSRYLITA